MPTVSIIIPCHNAAKTVLNAVSSVTSQHIDNFEIVLVNDASEDDFAGVVHEFIQKNPQVKVVLISHEKVQGVSTSRNDGVNAASGDYVTFLDADDEFEHDCLKSLLDTADSQEADMICCNIRMIHPDNNSRPQVKFSSEGQSVSFSCLDSVAFVKHLPFFDSSCAKLFRRSLIQSSGLCFKHELPFGEDTLFACCFALMANRIVILPNYCGYRYLLHQDSCSAKVDIKIRLASLRQLLLELEKVTPQHLKNILLRKSSEYLWTIRKFGGKEKRSCLEGLRRDKELSCIIADSIVGFGKFKHKLLWRFLQAGYNIPLYFW
ncbi:MAG: glycosyltransferase family 2 protein [Victivallales bacterium]|nr:glycosyltransferase family 2 protein [Victivallales bacterium]